MAEPHDEPRLRRLLDAVPDVVGELGVDQLIERVLRASVDLVDATWGELRVQGRDDATSPIQTEIGERPPSADGSELTVPLRARGRELGTLRLARGNGAAFSAEDGRYVASLASVAATALENARLFDETARRERWSTALAEVTAALLSDDTPDPLAMLAERVASVLDTELVCVIVPAGDDDGLPMLRVDTARGSGADELVGRRYPAADTLSARAIATGEIASTTDDPGESIVRPGRPSAAMALPVRAGDRVLGSLTVYRRLDAPPFSDADRTMAAEFALQAGVGIALMQARADRQQLELVEERGRIARDLHDHVIQRLFGTGLTLQAIAARTPDATDAIGTQIDAIDAAIGEIRTAIFALTPRPGAAETLRRRLLDVATDAAAGLVSPPVVTFAGPVDLLIAGDLADDVVAVVRESLANVSRHAEAGHVEVAVVADETEVTVTIDDDGIGIAQPPTRSSGTRNLDERARRRGGSFALVPRTTGGTRVRWSAPVSGAERTTP